MWIKGYCIGHYMRCVIIGAFLLVKEDNVTGLSQIQIEIFNQYHAVAVKLSIVVVEVIYGTPAEGIVQRTAVFPLELAAGIHRYASGIQTL